MIQSRTHNCGELRLPDIGKTVTLVGWMENMREVGSNLGFVVEREFKEHPESPGSQLFCWTT